MELTHDDIIAATRNWLEKAVIGLNLCPFAKAVYVKDQVRIIVSDAKDPAARKFARFVAGSYTAQTPEILAAIERAAPHVKRSNLPEPIECDGCGWKTKSLAAYQEHRNKHP